MQWQLQAAQAHMLRRLNEGVPKGLLCGHPDRVWINSVKTMCGLLCGVDMFWPAQYTLRGLRGLLDVGRSCATCIFNGFSLMQAATPLWVPYSVDLKSAACFFG